MRVAAEAEQPVRTLTADRLQQTLVILCVVDPCLPARKIRHHLQAGREDAQVSGPRELRLQPLPLARTEHGGLRVGIALVRPRYWPTGALEFDRPIVVLLAAQVEHADRRAVETQIRQQHLQATPTGAELDRVVDAVARTPQRIRRLTPEVAEDPLRDLLHGIVRAGIVLAVIVVIPGREHRHPVTQSSEARLRRELRVLRREHGGVARVTVDVVAQKYEQIRVGGEHRLPDRLRHRAFRAGAEGDALR